MDTPTERSGADRMVGVLGRIRQRYANGAPRPLGGYLVTLSGYGVFAGALATAVRRLRPRSWFRPSAGDLVLTTIATHKLSRLLAKDPIASPIRAPFTRYEESSGDAELHESVRGSGVAHAAGELVSCPFCLAIWVSTGLTSGLLLWPNTTRAACAVLSATAGSDTLQLAYSALKKYAES